MRDYEDALAKETGFRQGEEMRVERRLVRRHVAGALSVISFIRGDQRSDIAIPLPPEMLPSPPPLVNLVLIDAGSRRSSVAAAIRSLTPKSMTDIIRLMAAPPATLIRDMEPDDADAAAVKLLQAGAKVVVETT